MTTAVKAIYENSALIGFIDDAPADMAEHHDDYLYGRPRK